MQEDISQVAAFIEVAIRELGGFNAPARAKVMDFGCGKGRLVHALRRAGFDAYGCDVSPYWSGDHSPTSVPTPERLRTISLSPYRLPFDENTFDVVVSTSVLEHAQNKAD